MKEIRTTTNDFRALPKSRKIEGYALLFNSESNDLGGFREIIKPESVDGVLEKSDVLALYNHDTNKVMARYTSGEGTLKLTVDKRGLKYSFNAPKTALGDEVFDAIKRGDLRNSSFAFTVASDGQVWEKREDGSYTRTIEKFERLYDVSPVWSPAYSDTTVALRSLEEIRKEDEEEVEEKAEEEEEEKVVEEKADEKEKEEKAEDEEEEKVEETEPSDEEEEEEKPEPDKTDEEEKPVEDEEKEEKAEDEEEEKVMVDLEIGDNKYSIPEKVLAEYLIEGEAEEEEEDERKMEEYFEELETRIKNLKK